jgi:hypothetical protein
MAYILTIREPGNSLAGRGRSQARHATEGEAHAALVDWVRENWNLEMDGDELPDDEEEMIRQYFDFVLQEYEIAETPA